MEVAGWGRVPTTRAEVARPEREGQLRAIVKEVEGPLLAIGAGRSYGDAGLPVEAGRAMLTTRLDRILAFDEQSGRITAEPGVTFADLHRYLLPRGWLAPVCPGTAFATIGGAVANDVHGKNQGDAGSFGDHVEAFSLLTADGEVRQVTRSQDHDLFRSTIGGLGLTGVITSASFTMARVPSNAVLVEEQRINDLDSFLAAFEAKKGAHFSVGWIDALTRGRQFGRGILETAELASPGLPPTPSKAKTVPFDLPAVAMSPLSTRMFNAAWWRRVPADGRSRLVAIPAFLHPLDGIHQWNRIYGKRGFRQFQCVVPFDDGRATLVRLLEEVGRHGHASFLAVLKAFGRSGPGILSFCMPGWTLALDFPERPGVQELLTRLETIARDAGGRVYLAKDSHLSPETFAAMYPEIDRFRGVLERVDPHARWESALSRRLSIRRAVPS
jgi:decaprenylphospho-beta-D-ribofuranose 2-oxidase